MDKNIDNQIEISEEKLYEVQYLTLSGNERCLYVKGKDLEVRDTGYFKAWSYYVVRNRYKIPDTILGLNGYIHKREIDQKYYKNEYRSEFISRYVYIKEYDVRVERGLDIVGTFTEGVLDLVKQSIRYIEERLIRKRKELKDTWFNFLKRISLHDEILELEYDLKDFEEFVKDLVGNDKEERERAQKKWAEKDELRRLIESHMQRIRDVHYLTPLDDLTNYITPEIRELKDQLKKLWEK